jgi:hypothetical protein
MPIGVNINRLHADLAAAPTRGSRPNLSPWTRKTMSPAPWRLPVSGALAALLLPIPTVALAAPLVPGAAAQPTLGRFAGNSRYWRPDYVGTLRLRSAGAVAFTATAEVELQRQPESFPGSGIDTYEMRGLITLTSPLQSTHNGLTTTCQILKPVVPVRISRSGLTIYRGDEDFPRNTYEISVFQEVPLGECVSGDGRRSTIPFHSMEVNFDSSQLTIDGRPPDPRPLPESPAPFTPAEQAVVDEQLRLAEAMTHHPEMQQGLNDLIHRAQRERRAITPQEALALVERLRRRGVIPERLPSLSPERQAELKRLGGPHGAIDTSHLRRTPSLERLEDQMTVQTGEINRSFAWSLRRTGAGGGGG